MTAFFLEPTGFNSAKLGGETVEFTMVFSDQKAHAENVRRPSWSWALVKTYSWSEELQ